MLAAICISILAAFGAEWHEGPGYRSMPVDPAGGKTGFSRMSAAETGIAFTNHLSQRSVAINRVTENGSGVALGDFDGDGWCDVYLPALQGSNALYRNLGNWKFENVTASAGVACGPDQSTGAVFADVDGDGDLDLLVNSIGGGTRAFINQGGGKFAEVTGGRLVRRFGSSSLALGDLDLDGDLDLYVANYRTIVFKDELPAPKVEARMENGRIVVFPPGRFTAIPAKGGNAELFELGERDFIYVNDGKGNFAPVSWTTGNFLDAAGKSLTAPPQEWGLSAMIRDLNDDLKPDMIVCNDFFHSPDEIWFQQPGARFQLASRSSIRNVSLASMAVDVADINRDGLDDLFFVEMLGRDLASRQTHRDNFLKSRFNSQIPDANFRPEVPRNTLFLNRGDGTYAEIAQLAGVEASEWSWGAVFLDVDLDGFEDLLIPTGHNHDVQHADVLAKLSQMRVIDSIPQRMQNLSHFPPLKSPIIAFRNEGGLRFSESQKEWGLDIPGIANGFASGDLDNDGDLDLVANRLNGEALLLRNDSAAPRLAVRLKGTGSNTRGIGAKIVVRGARVAQQQTMICGGRYLSGDDTLRVFAADPLKPMTAEVIWPNSTRTVFNELRAGRIYELSQENAASWTPPSPKSEPAIFADVSDRLRHRHIDPGFDDFARQPLLPYKLSTQGPALAWADLDGDGLDDLAIGGSRGVRTLVTKNTGHGFAPLTNSFAGSRLLEDQHGLLFARLAGTTPTMISALANYESGSSQLPSIQAGPDALPGASSTTGALAVSDIDGDGDLDLFAAGRVLPGRYPSAASSRFFRNENGKFTLDEENSARFAKAGLLASACFADLDDDGDSDLVAAQELGPVRIWHNKGGRFESVESNLDRFTGWWTSVVVGDFDGDGRLDIVAGNWGRNTPFQRFLEKPLRIRHGDLDGSGTHDIIEAVHQSGAYLPTIGLETLQQTIPALAERFRGYAEYASATLDSVSPSGETIELSTLESVCFLNRGFTFEAHPLPVEAQFAPVFGIAVADFDGDGNEDLVLAQNLSDTRWDIGPLDSGGPLYLRGDGQGRFATVKRSGLAASGQQRAVAVADFNRDGRLDVAISQNNDETRLFENRGGAAGVRVRFAGGGKNPDAIGCRYRVSADGKRSAARELQCGAGWLSQNSLVQIIPVPRDGARLAVRWPGGKQSEFEIPRDARELLVTEDGLAPVKR